MAFGGPKAQAHLVPLMRYRDVGVACEWLCAAFGFEPHFAAKAPDGSVFYAELRFEHSMVMLGAVGVPALDALMQTGSADNPLEAQQSCYVIVDDVAEHYAQAKRSGADIVLDLKNDDMGGAGYSCRDPEGHVWNFGTYNPWKAQGQAARRKKKAARSSELPGYTAAIALTVGVSIVSGWFLYGHVRGGIDLERLRESLIGPRQELSTGGIGEAAGARAAKEAQAEVSRAHRAMQALQSELMREREAKADAERDAAKARAEADRTEVSRAELEKATAKARHDAERSAAAAKQEAADARAAARAESDKMIAALTEKSARETAASRTSSGSDTNIAVLKTEIARQHETVGQITADLKALQKELDEAQAERDAALKAVSEAKETTDREKAEKDSALKALADAGARIATLEVELSKVKQALQNASTARAVARARSTQTPVKKAKPADQPWPFSEW